MLNRRLVRNLVVVSVLVGLICVGMLAALSYGIYWIEDQGDRLGECAQATKYTLSGELDSPHVDLISNLQIPSHLLKPITAANASRVLELSKSFTTDIVRLLWKNGKVWGEPDQTSYLAPLVIRVPNTNSVLMSTVLGSDSTAIYECDLATGKLSRFIRYGARGFQFSPDYQILATNDGYGQIYLLDAQTFEERGVLNTANDSTLLHSNALAYSPDGSLVAFAVTTYSSTSQNGRYQIEIWNIKTQAKLAVLQGHTNYISDLAFSPDGSMLTSASSDGTVRVWGISSWHYIERTTRHDKLKPYLFQ